MSVSTPGAFVRRFLRVPPAKVFGAFADAALVAQWLRPSPEVTLTVLKLDFRPGGEYRFAYDAPDTERMVVGGTYRVIEHPSRIVFSWLIAPPDEHAGIESEVTVTIAPSGEGAVLTIRHDRCDRADADRRHEQGWGGALDLLEAHLGRES